MFNISRFFQKFSKIEAGNSEAKSGISKVIKKISGVQVENKDIFLQNGFLRINAPPASRQQIFMYKAKILSEINSGGRQVKDIR